MLELQKNSVIVSDAHYSKDDISFLSTIDDIKSNQIILNGDIFEFVSGSIDESIKYNKELVDKINEISKQKEIIYLEGNHDFVIKSLFKNVNVVSLKNQPLKCSYGKKVVYISHGDCFIDNIMYKIYTNLIRNRTILFFLNILDKLIGNNIFYSIINSQLKKDKCKKIKDFEKVAKDRVSKYIKYFDDIDYIIEGHYHQGVSFSFDSIRYINLSSFYCDKKLYNVSDLWGPLKPK